MNAQRRKKAVPAAPAGDDGGTVRERILEAAVAVLREQGIRQFTQPEVAARAKVRQSHLTYYFPTRHDLIEAATKRIVEGMSAGIGWALALDDSARGAMLERLAHAIADDEHMRMFIAVVVEADQDPQLRAIIVRATDLLMARLADAFGGSDTAGRARLVLAALWGLGFYRFVVRPDPDDDPTSQCLSLLTGTFPRTPRSGGRR